MSDLIILNGTSSAGKSTLAKALQRSFDAPYLHAGIDNYIFMLPGQYLNPPLWGEVFKYEYEGDQIAAIRTGPLGHQLMSAMHHSVAALADAGFNIIVDHVLLEPGWLAELARLCAAHRVWLVGVRCPLAVVEGRERDRKDRTLGQARAQYHVVHTGITYDIEVDTSQLDTDDCVRHIRAHPQSHMEPEGIHITLKGKPSP